MELETVKALRADAVQKIVDESKTAPSPGAFLANATTIAADPANLLELQLPARTLRPLYVEGVSANDSQNSRLVFEDIGPIARSNASDPRLWMYLTFVTYREYMESRWPLSLGSDLSDEAEDASDVEEDASPAAEGPGKKVNAWRRRAAERWVIQKASRRGLERHGISRLWWASELTIVDEPDRYRLTTALTSNQDLWQAVLDREIGSLRIVRQAILEKVSTTPCTRIQYRDLMKELYLEHGFRDLALLSLGEASDLVDELWV